MRAFLILFVFALILNACGDGTGTDSSTTGETEAPTTKYILTPFSASPEYTDASIGMMTYLQDTWRFDVTGESYKLGEQTPDAGQKMCANSAKGQHIHLIIENQPYNARYTAEFNDVPMADGDFHVLAFLSRSYHESIKTKTAHKAELMTIQDGSMKASESINEPMLFYSRPKGTYTGTSETKKVMLDFYIINLMLGDDYKVKANINNEEVHMIDKWQPYYIEGLPIGKNTIELTLVDGDGNTVDTPLNPVTREFELVADQLEQ